MKNQIKENLQKIGLTEYEVKIYLTLLEKESMSASELSAASGVPRSKSYEILNNLANKGLCVEIPDSIKKYTAVDPEQAIANIKHKLDQEMNEKILLLGSIESSLISMYSQRDSSDNSNSIIEVYRDKNTIWQKIQDLISKAEEEILVFSKEPYIVSVGKNNQSSKQIKESVSVRSIYEVKDICNQDYRNGIKEFIRTGEEVKVTAQLPVKMSIIDQKIVLLIINEKNNAMNNLLAIIINQAELANTFRIIFEFFWNQGKDFNDFVN